MALAVAVSACAGSPSPNDSAVGVYGNCADGDVACGAGGQATPIPEVTNPGTGGNATAGANGEEMPPDIVGIGMMNPAQGSGGAAPSAAGGGQGGDASLPPLWAVTSGSLTRARPRRR